MPRGKELVAMENQVSHFNEDDERERNLIQSFVNNEFFVSTIYRQSSACIESPPWYFETLVWEWKADLRERGKIVHSAASSYRESALKDHAEICRKLACGEALE